MFGPVNEGESRDGIPPSKLENKHVLITHFLLVISRLKQKETTPGAPEQGVDDVWSSMMS